MLEIVTTSPPPSDGTGSEGARPSAGVLARRFVNMLLDDAGREPAAPPSLGVSDFDPFPDLDLDLAPIEEEPEQEPILLSVDEAASAVLLASIFEADPMILRNLRREAPVVVVELASGMQDSFTKVLSVCVFGRATTMLSASRYKSFPLHRSDRRSAVVLPCEVSKSERALLEEQATSALSLAVPICALTGESTPFVPEKLRTCIDYTLRLPALTPPLLAILVEGVTGSAVSVPDEDWIGRLTIDDLRASVSPHRGAAGSLDRLRAVAAKRSALATDLPRLEDLSGYGEARTIGLALVQDLIAYRAGKIGWGEVERGLLLEGPPGVGKTLFARVLARTAGLPLVVASLAQWQSAGGGYLGDCLKAMAASFREARNLAPSILFIDELDSIGDRAAFDSRHKDYSTQVVNGLLEQLDGAADRTGVVVLGATNYARRIDPAILRPGRIDRVVRIQLPTPRDMVGILRTCLGGLLPDEDLMPAALAGNGGSGAEAAGWVRRARSAARRAGREVTMADLMEAIRDGGKGLPADVRDRVAMHEAGHACAGVALGVGDVDALVLHDNGGTALVNAAPGVTTRDRAFRRIVHTLAGRAAEILATGSPSAGAGGSDDSDLALATTIAVGIEASWGLGETGPIYLGDPVALRNTVLPLQVCLPAVMRIVRHAEAEADRLVHENHSAIRRCADSLLAAGYLEADQVLSALGAVPPFETAPPTASGSGKMRGDH